MRRAGWIVAMAGVLVLVPAATPVRAAPASLPAGLEASVALGQTGYVKLLVAGQPGATIGVSEIVGATRTPVAQLKLQSPTSARAHLVTWRCDRLDRQFEITAINPDGSRATTQAAVQTPSCAQRLAATLSPTHPRVGKPLTLTVTDRWGIGAVDFRSCIAAPGRRARCAAGSIPRGTSTATRALRVRRAGTYSATVSTAFGQSIGGLAVHAQRGRAHLRLLATGDSMIQIIDSFLASRLKAKGVRVHSDAHISTGISKPAMFNWPKHAAASASSLHPDVTVMFIGANDGFPFGTIGCCGAAWEHAYSDRVSAMMSAYARNGAGRVYWLLLPAPSKPSFARVFRPVNRAIIAAARRHPGTVHVVDLRRVFTPGGKFRRRVTYHGKTLQDARQADGVHLSTSGASLAANVIIAALRRDGTL